MDTINTISEEGNSSQEAPNTENTDRSENTITEENVANINTPDDVDKDLANLVTNLEIPDESNNSTNSNDLNVEATKNTDTEASTAKEATEEKVCEEQNATENESVIAEISTETDIEKNLPQAELNAEENLEVTTLKTQTEENLEKNTDRDAVTNTESEEHMEVDEDEVVESEKSQNIDKTGNSSKDKNVEAAMEIDECELNVNDQENIESHQTSENVTDKNPSMEIDKQQEALNIDNKTTNEVENKETVSKSTSTLTTDDNAVDSTEFISADKDNLDKRDVAQQSENDPIASESLSNSSENKTNEGDDSILPDTCKNNEETNKPSQPATDNNALYIVTKTNEKSSYICMECGKNDIPIYKCSFDSNTLYICTENCLKLLKEKKPEKVIVRDLRVKIFANQGLRNAMPLVPPAPEISNTNISIARCSECKELSKPSSIAWNSFNFCNEICLSAYQKINGTECIECHSDIQDAILGRYSVRFGKDIKQFCKNSCLLEHKKGQKFCTLCQGEIVGSAEYKTYCSKRCFELHMGIKQKKTGMCSVCTNHTELEIQVDDGDRSTFFCSDPCFVAFKFVSKKEPVRCEFCKIYKVGTSLISFFYDGIKHTLCSPDCRKLYIIMTRRIVHCAWCNVKKYNFDMLQFQRDNTYSILCSLNCYYLYKSGCDYCHKDTKPLFHITTSDSKVHNFCSALCLSLFKDGLTENPLEDKDDNSTDTGNETIANGTDSQPPQQLRPVKKIVVVRPRTVPKQRNMTTMCKPYQITKSITCKPKETSKGCQTDAHSNKFLLPVPVPIYVPTPVCMYSLPVPCPLPIPIPIPVPIFIPTTRKSVKGIAKELNKIKNKVPADPLEAELLMMAEMVAEDKKEDSDSESEEEPIIAKEETYHSEPEPIDTNNSFGEDVLQMALKMASDFEEPVDLEGAVSASTITPGTTEDSAQRIGNIMETKRRSIRQARQVKKKHSQSQQQVFTPAVPQTDMEKPDASLCLKYTFGVNAWKQWVTTKNIELQKTGKRAKLFKTEILQLTSDELNYSLCLFVKEVRKPNGAEYAPDTIYYLCLGIQQYLYESGRVDNIFCDTFYEKFTDCLNEVCQKFSLLYNESQYIVTRVEEEHLWESKQLGAHSPLVLLNTLMFFNTKHFSLTTVAEHLQLSFSHIMKHWKRNPNQPGSRNVLLRFYLPQTAEGTRKKKVYEQQENEDNPLRCPVKLYEFYLSKCPESVKTRNDVFYLQPERSCVPDSPVWYSTMALGQDSLEKMLNRVKMVKEINVAILTT